MLSLCDIKNTKTINLEKDWKLVTLFIGGNDLCHYCENPENHSTKESVEHIQRALDILYEELPRVFVNVVEVMELAGLYQGHGGKCAMPLVVQKNCSCFQYSQNPLAMQELKKVNWNLQVSLHALILLWTPDGRLCYAPTVRTQNLVCLPGVG
ncbi:phospholipase B1, membrane-associated-like isoform X2 [Acomys russatus]|uniref:phospholipase B1, membrane-associated-like isoform X2 n=1 Tax=Acomys russatus TaxID=60746 RepID=UPI0021E283D7|nr:phospholipase B1, membrane-associated-like isoform X2 [Acomys russatus]